MDRFFKWLNGQQPWVKALIFGAVFAVLVVAFALFLFKRDGKVVKVVAESESVPLQVQDATNDNSILSNLDMYKKESYNNGEMDPNQYWNQLLEEASRDSSSVRDGSPASAVAPGGGGSGQYLDPMVYSEMEIMMIRNGSTTREEVDRRHARDAELVRQMSQTQRSQPTAAQIQRERDSIYWARADRMYKMIAGDVESHNTVKHDTIYISGEEPDTVQLAKIGTDELATAGGNSSIISSLEDGEDKEMSLEYKGGRTTPSKATFFKTESLLDGQRVIMRLMQDLKLSNGKTVPANTHVSGICSTGKRLKIKINTVQYGGNIYYVDMCVYDNDGIEGIYCPVSEQKLSKRAQKSLGRQLVNDVASTAAGLFSSSPLAARMAQTNINTMSQIAFEDGSVAVNIVSGYEFYIAEAPKR